MNPLNLSGPEFLEFYGAAIVVAIVAIYIVRKLLKRGSIGAAAREPELDPFELAYLAGGALRTTQAALVSLANRGAITVGAGGMLSPGGTHPGTVSPAEALVLNAVQQSPTARFIKIHAQTRPGWRPLDDRLVGAGLLVPPATQSLARLIGFVLMLLVLVLGIAKVAVGMERHKPVGFLVFLCIATFILMIVMAALPLRRTPAGDAMLQKWVSKNKRLQSNVGLRQDENLMLAVALFGPTLLAGTALADLQRPISPVGSSGGGGDGGSSCGGSSCGGGGCGGCGGGGD